MDVNDWNVYLIALGSVVNLLLWQSVEVFEEQFNRPTFTVLKPRVKCYHGLWFKIKNGAMYLIHYANGKRDPLATNSMKIIEEELGGIEQKGQLTIEFKP